MFGRLVRKVMTGTVRMLSNAQTPNTNSQVSGSIPLTRRVFSNIEAFL